MRCSTSSLRSNWTSGVGKRSMRKVGLECPWNWRMYYYISLLRASIKPLLLLCKSWRLSRAYTERTQYACHGRARVIIQIVYSRLEYRDGTALLHD